VIKTFQGKVGDTTIGMWILAAIFVLRYLLGGA
jgi:hypothetical protein